jgi:hypothetical protein
VSAVRNEGPTGAAASMAVGKGVGCSQTALRSRQLVRTTGVALAAFESLPVPEAGSAAGDGLPAGLAGCVTIGEVATDSVASPAGDGRTRGVTAGASWNHVIAATAACVCGELASEGVAALPLRNQVAAAAGLALDRARDVASLAARHGRRAKGAPTLISIVALVAGAALSLAPR